MSITIKHKKTDKVLFAGSKADLSNADLRNADLSNAYLRNADLSGADLSNADLCGAYLRNADLHYADLRDADLRGADLSTTDLRGADLRGADLSTTDLRGADLDFSSGIPYHCGGTNFIGDDRLFAQMLYHLTRGNWSKCSGGLQESIEHIRNMAVADYFCEFRSDIEKKEDCL